MALLLLIVAGITLTVVPRPQADDKPDGAALFRSKCSMCHGVDGKGFAASSLGKRAPANDADVDDIYPPVTAASEDRQIEVDVERSRASVARKP